MIGAPEGKREFSAPAFLPPAAQSAQPRTQQSTLEAIRRPVQQPQASFQAGHWSASGQNLGGQQPTRTRGGSPLRLRLSGSPTPPVPVQVDSPTSRAPLAAGRSPRKSTDPGELKLLLQSQLQDLAGVLKGLQQGSALQESEEQLEEPAAEPQPSCSRQQQPQVEVSEDVQHHPSCLQERVGSRQLSAYQHLESSQPQGRGRVQHDDQEIQDGQVKRSQEHTVKELQHCGVASNPRVPRAQATQVPTAIAEESAYSRDETLRLGHESVPSVSIHLSPQKSCGRDLVTCTETSLASVPPVVDRSRWPSLPSQSLSPQSRSSGLSPPQSPQSGTRSPMSSPGHPTRAKLGVAIGQAARSPTLEASAREIPSLASAPAVADGHRRPQESALHASQAQSRWLVANLTSSSKAGVHISAESARGFDMPNRSVEQAIARSLAAAGGRSVTNSHAPPPCARSRQFAALDSELHATTGISLATPPSTSSSAVLIPVPAASPAEYNAPNRRPDARHIDGRADLATPIPEYLDVLRDIEDTNAGKPSTAEHSLSAASFSSRRQAQRLVLVYDVSVTKGLPRGSEEIAILPAGAIVEAVEFVHVEAEQRLRARILAPAGWMSFRNTKTGLEWARPEAEARPAKASRNNAPENGRDFANGSCLEAGEGVGHEGKIPISGTGAKDENTEAGDAELPFSTSERKAMWLSIHDVAAVCQELAFQDTQKQNANTDVRQPFMLHQHLSLPHPQIPAKILEILFGAYDPNDTGEISMKELAELLQDMQCTACLVANRQGGFIVSKARDDLAAVVGSNAAGTMSDAIIDMLGFEMQMAKAFAAEPVSMKTVRRVHRELDADGDGKVSHDDFRSRAASVLFDPNPPQDVREVAHAIDAMMQSVTAATRPAMPGTPESSPASQSPKRKNFFNVLRNRSPAPSEASRTSVTSMSPTSHAQRSPTHNSLIASSPTQNAWIASKGARETSPASTVSSSSWSSPNGQEYPKTLAARMSASPKGALRPPQSPANGNSKDSSALFFRAFGHGGGASPPQVVSRAPAL